MPEIEEVFEEMDEDLEKIEVSLLKFKSSIMNENSIHVNTLHEINSNKTQIRLPDISLPKFSGLLEEWYTFKQQFDSLITNNVNLDDSHKLFYLKSALIGNARQIQTTEDTFSSLFKALSDRFENKRLLVNAHINDLINLEKINHESAMDLRNMLDKVTKNLRSLKSLNLELDVLSENIITNIVLQRVDKETRKLFELSLENSDLPKWQNVFDFLSKRCNFLESIQGNTVQVKSKPVNKFKSLVVEANVKKLCVICRSGNHPIFKCSDFLKFTVKERFNLIKRNNLCLICFSPSHKSVHCNNCRYSCRFCSKPHNSLLHFSSKVENNKNKNESFDSSINDNDKNSFSLNKPDSEEPFETVCASTSCLSKSQTLLATAVIFVKDVFGNKKPLRFLCDSGSMINALSKDAVTLLRLKEQKLNMTISGLNESVIPVKSKVWVEISNASQDFMRRSEFVVVSKITSITPVQRVNIDICNLNKYVKFADPKFYEPGRIDGLIGCDLFFDMLKSKKLRVKNSHLILQESAFGFLVSGSTASKDSNVKPYCCLIQTPDSLEENIQKFWKIENVENESRLMSDEDQLCERHFLDTYRRDDSGRFVVSMPLKEDAHVLGDSKNIAEKRLEQLWNRLDKIPVMRQLYCDFMQEYENLNHMRRVTDQVDKVGSCYYLPHHGVYRPEKSTTKLRVVFNASSATSNGKTLNDILLKGFVKEDLYDIMIRFRKHKYVFLADIEKMFRQISITEEQRKLLRILWKSDIKSPVEEYELNTVTYGTACAPFLAIRTLQQLALEEAENFPKASEVLLNDCYMDDVISGENSLEAAKDLQHQLIEILKSAGMSLHKWNANHTSLLKNVNKENLGYTFSENETKALGVTWNPSSDIFMFKVKIEQLENLTKRKILSDIARIYDPMGLIGPVITKAKVFMQDLWKLKLDWNETIPDTLAQSWIEFTTSLKTLENLAINRYVLIPNAQKIILHGFADASSVAFGAAVYLQSFNDSEIACNLVSSKSQIAPLKTVTIPRLELSACLLLSKLVVRIIKALKLAIDDVYLYTDSQIALAWIQTPPWKLKTFVSNRVAKIQNCTQDFHWKHIASSKNPADVISRGLDALELIDNQFWFHGPSFLTQETVIPELEPSSLTSIDDEIMMTELKEISVDSNHKQILNSPRTLNLTVNSACNDFYSNLFSLTNDFLKLIRIVAFIYRFYHKCKGRAIDTGSLTAEELRNAETHLIRQVQVKYFSPEIEALKKGLSVPSCSKLKFLNIFLDSENIIRVGGRLSHSNVNYNHKFPIVLPARHKLVKMIFLYYHNRDFHVGPQALLNTVRQKYWPLGGRSISREIVHKCVRCCKTKPVPVTQIMGDLPPERVLPSSAFLNTGLDLAGPFEIKYKGQRKGPLQKVYVVVFVCMATKAVHLEFVSDLTSQALIATLKRFFARRGRSSVLFSDNATNFVGAFAEIKRLYKLMLKDRDVSNFLAAEGITWKFLPPRAPNFGGIWEAGVKAFKYHFKRAVGAARLTLEEFLTVLVQIEGILNSRPLSPIPTDDDDFQVLTPGHFLVGKPLNSIPEPNLIDQRDNLLDRWKRVQKLVQIVWKRWQNSYLSSLQQRSKWLFKRPNVLPGMVVILIDSQLPPCNWSIGRIIKAIPGSDGNVRVVDVRTAKGDFRRPISKICILPIEDNQQHN